MSYDELKRVTWRDAFYDYDLEGELTEDFIVETVGWVLRSGPKFISVASEKLPEGWRAVTHIPVELVQKVASLGTLHEA